MHSDARGDFDEESGARVVTGMFRAGVRARRRRAEGCFSGEGGEIRSPAEATQRGARGSAAMEGEHGGHAATLRAAEECGIREAAGGVGEPGAGGQAASGAASELRDETAWHQSAGALRLVHGDATATAPHGGALGEHSDLHQSITPGGC